LVSLLLEIPLCAPNGEGISTILRVSTESFAKESNPVSERNRNISADENDCKAFEKMHFDYFLFECFCKNSPAD